MSSLSFVGNVYSYMKSSYNDFNFGTGDFTIEWYQYQTDTNSFPRIFQMSNPAEEISIGVSINGGSFYYWTNNSANLVATLASSSYKNTWVHFAICRASGVTNVFMNGTSIFSMNDTNDFNGASDLTIANETTPSDDAAFGGYLTYFSWVKGVALYTSDFTVSNDYPTVTNDYVLLLTGPFFYRKLYNVYTFNICTTPNVPPNFISSNLPPQPEPELAPQPEPVII